MSEVRKPIFSKNGSEGKIKKRRKKEKNPTGFRLQKDQKKRTGRELAIFGKAVLMTVMLAVLFYHSLAAAVFLLPLTVCLVRKLHRQAGKQEEMQMRGQFKDGILAFAASLRAGHSAENAMRDAAGELELLYGAEAVMTQEFHRAGKLTEMNVPLEQAVREMAARCGLTEMTSFAEVFAAARRTGGELGSIVTDTVRTISGQLEVKAEIETMLRGRMFEQKIMKGIPPFILIYMEVTSPGFFTVLYETVTGRIVMTICLGVYLAAGVLADRIADICV